MLPVIVVPKKSLGVDDKLCDWYDADDELR